MYSTGSAAFCARITEFSLPGCDLCLDAALVRAAGLLHVLYRLGHQAEAARDAPDRLAVVDGLVDRLDGFGHQVLGVGAVDRQCLPFLLRGGWRVLAAFSAPDMGRRFVLVLAGWILVVRTAVRDRDDPAAGQAELLFELPERDPGPVGAPDGADRVLVEVPRVFLRRCRFGCAWGLAAGVRRDRFGLLRAWAPRGP